MKRIIQIDEKLVRSNLINLKQLIFEVTEKLIRNSTFVLRTRQKLSIFVS